MRLTRKYADAINGVDLSHAHVGDRLALSPHDADLLIAEGWAERAAPRARPQSDDVRSIAADKPRRRKTTPKNKKR